MQTTPQDLLLGTAEQRLLQPYELETGKLERVFGALGAHRIDYADLYFQYARSESWSLEEGIVKSGSFNIEQGVGVRAIAGEKTAFAYSDEISFDALEDAARATRAIAAAGQSRRTRVARRGQPVRRYEPLDPLATLASEAKVALLEKLERMCRALDPRVKQVMAQLGGEYEVVLVARSDGVLSADVRPLVRLSVQVIAEQNGRRESGYAGGGGRTGYAHFSDEVLKEYARQGGGAGAGQSGGAPGAGRHHDGGAGPGLAGDPAARGDRARPGGGLQPQGQLGLLGPHRRARGRAGVTVVDDGTLPGRRGSLNVDDEGNPTTRTVLIEDGVLRGYIQDSLNARLMKMPLTGNGRRESFAHLVLPRMTNTYMLAGPHDPREIVAGVERGVYAVNFGGGQVDITNGKFVFSAAEAYMIENGKVTHPIKGATLIGNGPDALTRVTMIGNDLQLDSGIGTCGKEGQSVPVGVGQPTLRIDGLTVGGTS